MPTIIALLITFLFGMYFTAKKYQAIYVWLSSCLIIPVLILIDEFIIPYQDGGASFWPIALIFGILYSAVAGGLGVFMGLLIKKKRHSSKDKN